MKGIIGSIKRPLQSTVVKQTEIVVKNIYSNNINLSFIAFVDKKIPIIKNRYKGTVVKIIITLKNF